MPEEPSLCPSPADAPVPSKYENIVKRLFEEHPSGEYQEVIRTGFYGLDNNDLALATACAEHVIACSKSGSGDLMRAMILRAFVYERSGNIARHNTLLDAVIGGRF